ncbi:ABC transporter permease [Cohaesibacter celericrescens]|uniref:ABC transporter permease n=1 Tax=Cohaesibacter celericrescens TaxID=2067669 RepID=A0A2N5XV24_9HYPH|nr:ABC transporter permease [Cohaesibacter celericrescens]PLW78307.1 ABC transporter permease [Cohaesibacter celericrescens]
MNQIITSTREHVSKFLNSHQGIVVPVIAVLLAFAFGMIVVVAMGVPLNNALGAFWQGAFGNAYAISASLNRAVVLALVGIGFVIANRAGLTNVGGEGQIAVGGIAATALCLTPGIADLPFGLSFLIPLVGAAFVGGIWGALAGVLKTRSGTNEVISTLLLSFIGTGLLYWSVQSENLLRQPMTSSSTLPESASIPMATQVPLLTGSYASPVTYGLPILLLLAVIAALVLSRSIFGFQLRSVGHNPTAAARAGISVGLTLTLALFIAGAFGGLAGGVMLQGEQYSLKAGFSSGFGFDGLVVGLLARGSVPGVIAGALLFGFMRSGGISMEMIATVPSSLVGVIQGLIVLLIAGAAYYLDKRTTP